MDFFIQNAWVVVMLPFWAFLLIVFGQNTRAYESKTITTLITTVSTFIGLVFAVFIMAKLVIMPDYVFQTNINWLKAGDISLSLGFLVDKLSAVMMLIVTSVSLLIQIYSHEYMNHDKGFHRFFAYLALFNFSMLGLVLSSNLFEIYIFWELVGLSSYLLIGFWYQRPSAANAAKKAFIMNRIGDFGLLVGIMAFLYYSLSMWINGEQVFLGIISLNDAALTVINNAGPFVFSLIAFAMLLGPIAKSAQFPLHTWLPDAMEGPTPISALIHAATMVAAGVFLIARMYPIFELAPSIMTLMAWIGGITALITATIALTQLDIKKALAYSTCSQLGYMVMAMGVGAYGAGLFHLMTHAYFKALLFLCSGAVIHGLSEQQNMRYMGGLRKHMPAVAYTYLIGTFAISGLFLSGFWSKEEIFLGLSNNLPLLGLGILVAGMTSFYSFRTYFMTFEGEYKGHVEPHNASSVITIPLILLAIPSALVGLVLSGKFMGLTSFGTFIQPLITENEQHSLVLPLISLLIALIGFILAAAMYWDVFKQRVFSINPSVVKKYSGKLYNLSFNKCYFDEIYGFLISKIFLGFARLTYFIDKYIIDGFVAFMTGFTRLIGQVLCLFQNGNIQTYATILFSGIAFISIVITAYYIF